MVKNPFANAGDITDMDSNPDSVPELGRSLGGGHGNPLQRSCLENPIDRGAWLAMVYRVAKSLLSAQLLRHVRFFVTLWTVACQAPLSMGFSRQEY